jgi:hypothetical protein
MTIKYIPYENRAELGKSVELLTSRIARNQKSSRFTLAVFLDIFCERGDRLEIHSGAPHRLIRTAFITFDVPVSADLMPFSGLVQFRPAEPLLGAVAKPQETAPAVFPSVRHHSGAAVDDANEAVSNLKPHQFADSYCSIKSHRTVIPSNRYHRSPTWRSQRGAMREIG